MPYKLQSPSTHNGSLHTSSLPSSLPPIAERGCRNTHQAAVPKRLQWRPPCGPILFKFFIYLILNDFLNLLNYFLHYWNKNFSLRITYDIFKVFILLVVLTSLIIKICSSTILQKNTKSKVGVLLQGLSS